jgi:signal transduction histidine kinase
MAEVDRRVSEVASEPAFWDRTRIGWHVAFYVLVAVAALPFVIDASLPSTRRVFGLAVVGMLAAWYGLLGRRLLGTDAGWLGLVYVLGVLAGFLALLLVSESAYVLLFVVFPQVWAILRLPFAISAIVIVVAALVTVELLTGTPANQAAVTGLVNLAVSLVLGLWITGIVRESEKRADLITELERTRAELATAHLEKGALAERERLAAEIHDTLAQGFMSILVLAQAADAALDEEPAAAHERLMLIEGTARENLAEARSLVAALGPVDLQQTTLVEALGRLVERLVRELGIKAALAVEGPPRQLSANAEVVLLRATQEALTNVRKHSGAERVEVTLCYGDTGAELVVRDDGRGFDPEQAGGFGLPGMRARAEQVGGSVDVESSPGRGSMVRVRVP